MKGKHLVERTNDWSIDSKRSMVDLGYFKDDFINLFSTKKRRSPLINICYYVRAYVIDKALRHFQCNNFLKYQVISLGAGFDTSYFRLFSKDKNVKFVEIDLPSVVKKKIDILLNNDITRQLLTNVRVEKNNDTENSGYSLDTLISDNYILLSLNLENTDLVDARLNSLNIDYDVPTIIFSEVAITYMEEISCTRLCKFLSAKFSNAALLVYEQINPTDGFGQFMLRHFEMIQSPLKALTRYNQVKDQKNYYINNGWKECSVIRVMDLYSSIVGLEEFMSKIKLEPLDEWEEFHLTCLHYGLYVAVNGSMTDLARSFSELCSSNITSYIPPVEKQLILSFIEIETMIKRFGHNLIQLDEDIFVMFGGVAVEKNCHGKSSIFQIVDLQNQRIHDSETRFDQFALTDMASCSVLLENSNEKYFMIHGGCKSPSRGGQLNPFIVHYESPSAFTIQPVAIKEESSKPCHRWRHVIVSSNADIFIFGGRNSNLEVLDDLWKLTLSCTQTGWSGVWTLLDSSPCGRFSHSCASLPNGGFIITGGLNRHIKPLGDIWMWLPVEGWSSIDIVNSIPRYGHTSHLVNDRLFLVGGITFHPMNPGVSIIDLKLKSSTHYNLPDACPESPIMLHNHQSVITNNKKEIIVFGGGGNCFSFGTSFNKCIIKIPCDQFM